MSLQLSLVLACGVIALLYGGWLVQQLLALSPGTKEMQERTLKGTRSWRLGHPRDIAAMVAFLLSDDGEWMNGQVISVDGGVTLR